MDHLLESSFPVLSRYRDLFLAGLKSRKFSLNFSEPRGNYLTRFPQIGNDRLPTFSPTERPSSCETQTATLLATTTSFGVSVSAGATVTTTTRVLSTSADLVGCNVRDGDSTATATGGCPTQTATNVWVSCAAGPTSSCTTTKTSVVTGCDVTPTTRSCARTATRQPTTTGIAARQASDEDVCEVEAGQTYIIYPRDWEDRTQTKAIAAKLETMADPSDIRVVEARCCGVVYWSVQLTAEQAEDLRNDDNVSLTLAKAVVKHTVPVN